MIKTKHRKILLLSGDGIGPEVIAEVKKVIQWYSDLVVERVTNRLIFHW